jgi:hypothetical protein
MFVCLSAYASMRLYLLVGLHLYLTTSLRLLQIYIDSEREVLFLPIYGISVPFHFRYVVSYPTSVSASVRAES